MTTLSSGNSVTVTLSPDQYVTVTTAPNTEGMISVSPASASANLESGSPANTAACQRFGPPCVLGKKYGPYGDTVNLTLQCTTGSVDYVLSSGSARVSIDPVTGGIVIPLGTSGMVPVKIPNTVVLLGDSLSALCGGPVYSSDVPPTDFSRFGSGAHYFNTEDNTYYTSNGSVWSATAPGTETDGHQNVSWIMHAMQKAFQPLRIIHNAGVVAQTSTQILARFDDEVTAKNPGIVSIFVGANDPNAGVSAATTIANIQSMVAKAIAANIVPIVGTLWPNSVINTAAELEALDTINRYIRTLDRMAGVFVWDGFAAISSGNNTYPGTTILYDGTHQAPQGSMMAGYQMAKPLTKMSFIAQPTLPDVSTNSTHNLCYNGAAHATTGGGNTAGTNGWSVSGALTGVGPDGWDAGTIGTWGTDTVVSSIIAPTDGNGGNWNAYTISAVGGSTDGHAFYAQMISSQSSLGRSQAYQLGDSRVEAGNRYVCIANGTTAGSAPAFDTATGATTTDGTVTWKRVENIAAGDEIEFAYEYEMDATLASAGVFVSGYVEIYVSGSKILQIGSTYSKSGFPTLHPTKGIFIAPPVKIPANCTSIIHYARVYLKAAASGVFKMRAASSLKII